MFLSALVSSFVCYQEYAQTIQPIFTKFVQKWHIYHRKTIRFWW